MQLAWNYLARQFQHPTLTIQEQGACRQIKLHSQQAPNEADAAHRHTALYKCNVFVVYWRLAR